jgi:hypothetical protein
LGDRLAIGMAGQTRQLQSALLRPNGQDEFTGFREHPNC